MICPRCDSPKVELLTKAPVDDAWEVYICDTCCFSWRSTEDEEIINPEKYDKRFKIDPSTISTLAQLPPIPELRKNSKI